MISIRRVSQLLSNEYFFFNDNISLKFLKFLKLHPSFYSIISFNKTPLKSLKVIFNTTVITFCHILSHLVALFYHIFTRDLCVLTD